MNPFYKLMNRTGGPQGERAMPVHHENSQDFRDLVNERDKAKGVLRTMPPGVGSFGALKNTVESANRDIGDIEESHEMLELMKEGLSAEEALDQIRARSGVGLLKRGITPGNTLPKR